MSDLWGLHTAADDEDVERYEPWSESYKSSSTPFIARGTTVEFPENDHDLFHAIHERRATPEHLLRLITHNGEGNAGVWWGTYGGEHREHDPEGTAYGDLVDFQDHTEAGANDDLAADYYVESGQYDPNDSIIAQVPVVMIGQRPKRGKELWDPEIHNPPNGLMGNSYLKDDEPVPLHEIHYHTGTDWMKVKMPKGISVKASTDGVRYAHLVEADVAEDLMNTTARLAAFGQDLIDRLHGEFHDWWEGAPEDPNDDREWEYYGDGSPLNSWAHIERFMADRYPAAHKNQFGGNDEARPNLLNETRRNQTWGGPEEIGQHGYDPAEIAAGMLILHHQSHGSSIDQQYADQDTDFFSKVFDKRQQMQRAYEQRTKTAMPAPAPEGLHFKVHPDNDSFRRAATSQYWDYQYNVDHFPAVTAHVGDNPTAIGHLEWFQEPKPGDKPSSLHRTGEPGEVSFIHVRPEYRRSSVATSMFDWVKQNLDPRLHHSDERSGLGRQWVDHEQNRQRTAMPMPLPKGVTFTPFGPGDDLHREVAEKHNMDAYADVWDRMSGVAAHLNGNQVGHLVWFHPGVTDTVRGKTVDISNEVGSIQVNDELQHHSVATGMWDYARSLNPDLRHSPVKTQDGRGWADYEQSRHARIAMPAPLPEDATFHYHTDYSDVPRLNYYRPINPDFDVAPEWEADPTDWVHRGHPGYRENELPGFPVPAVEARVGGKHAGYLSWHPEDNHVIQIQVFNPYTRQNIATSMFDFAKQHEPRLHHSDQLTPDGEGWSQYEKSRNARLAMAWEDYGDRIRGGCRACHDGWEGRYTVPQAGAFLNYVHADNGGDPEVRIQGIYTHPSDRGDGVAEALIRRLSQDHPGVRINPGYMTADGQKFHDRMVEKDPSARDRVTAGFDD